MRQVDWEKHRSGDCINLYSAFTDAITDEAILTVAEMNRASEFIARVGMLQPIKSRQVAAVILAAALHITTTKGQE